VRSVVLHIGRVQDDNFRSIDLVTHTVMFLDRLVRPMEEMQYDEMVQACQCLATIVEITQGNIGNQRAVLDAHVIDIINGIVRDAKGIVDHESSDLRDVENDPNIHAEITRGGGGQRVVHELSRETVLAIDMDLSRSCAILCQAMLNNNEADTAYVASQLQETLDIRVRSPSALGSG
jgi:hypothetical protein